MRIFGEAGPIDADLDAESEFPLAYLEVRLKCPRCGPRRFRLAFIVPASPFLWMRSLTATDHSDPSLIARSLSLEEETIFVS